MRLSKAQQDACLALAGQPKPKRSRAKEAKSKPATQRSKEDIAFDEIVLFCRSKGFPEPERQYRFSELFKYKLDFAWPAPMDPPLAVELHGGVWSGGRHTRGKGFTKDRAKMNEAQLRGWRVLEVTYDQVKSGEVWAWLERAFEGDVDEV